ncbi:MAG: glucosaminidase domain-containing protein [Saprospiraceae bacterium]
MITYVENAKVQTKLWFHKNWLNIGLFAFAAFVITQKDLSVQFNLNAAPELATTEVAESPNYFAAAKTASDVPRAMNTSLITRVKETLTPKGSKKSTASKKVKTTTKVKDDNLANTYSNMTFNVKEFATKEAKKVRTSKQKKQLVYVEKYLKVAQREMKEFGIPASITLAQGLIESNCGDSKLATRNKNHFGMKCFSRKCRKGHCSNFTDDSHKDFFRIYKSSWDSFRSHSHLLSGKRYRHLKKLKKSDYRGWAKGLKKAGYATDKYYAEKLINLIENLDLDKYDRI